MIIMRESPNLSENRNVVSPGKIKNLKRVLDICEKIPEISDLLKLQDKEKRKTSGIGAKLTKIGNDYYIKFKSYKEEDFVDEKKFNEIYMAVQKFLAKLSKIFNEKVKAGEKWNNDMVDWFVKEIFKLNDSFCELNKKINDKKKVLSKEPWWLLYGWFNHGVNLSVLGTNNINNNYDFMKNDNKRLWIIVYRPLLKLINEELEILLGKISEKKENLESGNMEDYKNEINEKDMKMKWDNRESFDAIIKSVENLYLEKKGIVSKKDIGSLVKKFWDLLIKNDSEKFNRISKKLFIMDYLNVNSYEDFCNKYDILKDMQKYLFDLEKLLDGYFDESWNLKLDEDFKGLYMKNLARYLEMNYVDRIFETLRDKR